MKYQVITEVPPASNKGNLAVAIREVYVDEQAEDYWTPCRAIEEVLGNPIMGLALRKQVFTLGEVLLVGDDGRELVAHQRKADKWDVTYETFDTPEAAVARAQEVASEPVG